MTVFPVDFYLLKVNNRNTRARCEIYSALTAKTPERCLVSLTLPKGFLKLSSDSSDVFRHRQTFTMELSGKIVNGFKTLTLSRRRSLSYRNQSIDLQSKSMDWSLYDRDFRLETAKLFSQKFRHKFLPGP